VNGWLTDDKVIDRLKNALVVPFNLILALNEGLSWIWYSVSDDKLQGNTKEVEASMSPMFPF